MKFKDYRALFQVASLGLVLLAASPALSLVVSFPSGTEKFSEFWLLGPNYMAEDYPFNVQAGESHSLSLGVGNHLGHSGYYLVYFKFRNQSQLLPDASSSEPSPVASFYELQFLVADGDIWETLITFEVLNVSIQDSTLVIESVAINGKASQVGSSSIWDSENSGFHFQLFFELWLYDVALQSFSFHERFVGIWLDITA